MSKVQFRYTGTWKGCFSGDRSAVDSEEAFQKLKDRGAPVKRITTEQNEPTKNRAVDSASKSDEETREALKKEALDQRREKLESTHHNTLRAHVTDVAEQLGEPPPQKNDKATSVEYLLEHWDVAKEHVG